jgi:hypothetical protein
MEYAKHRNENKHQSFLKSGRSDGANEAPWENMIMLLIIMF